MASAIPLLAAQTPHGSWAEGPIGCDAFATQQFGAMSSALSAGESTPRSVATTSISSSSRFRHQAESTCDMLAASIAFTSALPAPLGKVLQRSSESTLRIIEESRRQRGTDGVTDTSCRVGSPPPGIRLQGKRQGSSSPTPAAHGASGGIPSATGCATTRSGLQAAQIARTSSAQRGLKSSGTSKPASVEGSRVGSPVGSRVGSPGLCASRSLGIQRFSRPQIQAADDSDRGAAREPEGHVPVCIWKGVGQRGEPRTATCNNAKGTSINTPGHSTPSAAVSMTPRHRLETAAQTRCSSIASRSGTSPVREHQRMTARRSPEAGTNAIAAVANEYLELCQRSEASLAEIRLLSDASHRYQTKAVENPSRGRKDGTPDRARRPSGASKDSTPERNWRTMGSSGSCGGLSARGGFSSTSRKDITPDRTWRPLGKVSTPERSWRDLNTSRDTSSDRGGRLGRSDATSERIGRKDGTPERSWRASFTSTASGSSRLSSGSRSSLGSMRPGQASLSSATPSEAPASTASTTASSLSTGSITPPAVCKGSITPPAVCKGSITPPAVCKGSITPPTVWKSSAAASPNQPRWGATAGSLIADGVGSALRRAVDETLAGTVAKVDNAITTLASKGFLSVVPRPWLGDSTQHSGHVVPDDLSHVQAMFLAQLPGSTVTQVHRLENAGLNVVYSAVRETMNCKAERILWHGTSADCVQNITLDGFNRAYCGRHGMKYGQGTYFSTNAGYSVRFCAGRRAQTRVMFLAKVLVGDSTTGSPELREPPRRDDQTLQRYDSTVDNTASPNIFCVFKDFQALPLYLVEFVGP